MIMPCALSVVSGTLQCFSFLHKPSAAQRRVQGPPLLSVVFIMLIMPVQSARQCDFISFAPVALPVRIVLVECNLQLVVVGCMALGRERFNWLERW